ncbi:hypothetical protein [Bacillus sp. ISL-37]|uniref:hypothetical protein n=1 Tax=Bacillus sp. ISL-37 TaxID=2819123 RepID=UPI001BE7CA0C|nr:hypothetical protein [Bacillus sp. ISL-37]MBT2686035.1 hypothetical protein [Bacillus sp. ISL-37]
MEKIAFILTLLGLMFVAGCTNEPPAVEKKVEPPVFETKMQGYGDEEYNRIRVGMTIDEVNEIIGFEGELMGGSNGGGVLYQTFTWQLNKEASIGGDFENGKLVLKGGWNPRDKWRQEKDALVPTVVIGVNDIGEGLGSEKGFGGILLYEILASAGYKVEFKSFNRYGEEQFALQSDEVNVLLDVEATSPRLLYSETYDYVHTSELKYAFASKNSELLDVINQRITAFKSNGRYKELFIEFYGEENYVENGI